MAQKPPIGTVIETASGAHSIFDGKNFVPAAQGASGWAVDRRAMASMGVGQGAPVMVDAKGDQAAVETDRAKAAQSLMNAQQAQRFMQLNEGHPTGGAMGWPVVGGMVREAKASSDSAYAQMDQISSALAPKLRPVGSGSSSDKDTSMYVRGFTNLQVPKEANASTARDYQRQSNRDAAYAAWRDKWFETKGTLLGADVAFNRYWSDKTRNGDPYMDKGAELKAKSASREPKLLGYER